MVEGLLLALAALLLLSSSCQTPGREVLIIDCQEQMRGDQLRYAKMLKGCRDELRDCRDELNSCLDDEVDYD